MAHRRIVHKERESDGAEDIVLRLGPEELMFRRRYEFASMLNDFMIGFWFLIGSIAFFFPAWKEAGIWLFVLGSAQLLIRPGIRLMHRTHLRRAAGAMSNWDL